MKSASVRNTRGTRQVSGVGCRLQNAEDVIESGVMTDQAEVARRLIRLFRCTRPRPVHASAAISYIAWGDQPLQGNELTWNF